MLEKSTIVEENQVCSRERTDYQKTNNKNHIKISLFEFYVR